MAKLSGSGRGCTGPQGGGGNAEPSAAGSGACCQACGTAGQAGAGCGCARDGCVGYPGRREPLRPSPPPAAVERGRPPDRVVGTRIAIPPARPRVLWRKLEVRGPDGDLVQTHHYGREIDGRHPDDLPYFKQRGVAGERQIVSVDLHSWTGDGLEERTESVTYVVPRGVLVLPDSASPGVQPAGPGPGPSATRAGLRYDDGTVVERLSNADERRTATALVRVRGGEADMPATTRWNRLRRAAGVPEVSRGQRDLSNALRTRAARMRAADVVAFVTAHGGTVLAGDGGTSSLVVEAPLHAIRALLDVPGVRSAAVVRPGARIRADSTYACTGAPSPSRSDVDVDSGCTPGTLCPGLSQGCMFLDAAAETMGVTGYHAFGFYGGGSGGNDPDYLVAGVSDTYFNLMHPAWNDGSGNSRVLEEWATLRSRSATPAWYPTSDVTWPVVFGIHGTVTAAIIGADATAGQYPNLSTVVDRESRSGFAPQVRLRFADLENGPILDDSSGTESIEAFGLSGHEVDTLNISWGWSPCVTDERARGKDSTAQAVNRLYQNSEVVVTKSGGNLGGGCPAGLLVSAPAASASIGVGVTQNVAPPSAAQTQPVISGSTSGDTTPDGRSWPHLVTPNQICGAASGFGYATGIVVDGQWWDGYSRYGIHGASSAAAPRVSGATILFKEWYISKFGDHANQAGRLICNILNMGDRFNTSGGGAVQSSLRPQPFWGLGHFRLHEWGSENRVVRTAGFFLTASVTLGSNGYHLLDISQTNGIVSGHVRRLNALVWWDEPNTGSGQTKPHVSLYLIGGGAGLVQDYSNNENGLGREQMVSLTFDSASEPKPCPTGGVPLWLLLSVDGAIEPDGDDQTDAVYNDTREFFISCTWEVGTDDTLVDCDGGTVVVGPVISKVVVASDTCSSRISNLD